LCFLFSFKIYLLSRLSLVWINIIVLVHFSFKLLFVKCIVFGHFTSNCCLFLSNFNFFLLFWRKIHYLNGCFKLALHNFEIFNFWLNFKQLRKLVFVLIFCDFIYLLLSKINYKCIFIFFILYFQILVSSFLLLRILGLNLFI